MRKENIWKRIYEREYMKENNVQVFNSFLQPKGNNSYDLVITVQDNK